jgi:hypothetical protein
VALVDVVRAAVSEIEQYERVMLNIQPEISIRGQAVSDVVHLLSELTENATVFSPSETPVKVSGHLLNSGGMLLDVIDQGVGMDAQKLAHANWRLDNPPVVDVAVSRRMGLFVVARLAARHGIRVRLRPAPMRGLTALVWLPDEVITREAFAATLDSRRFRPPTPGGAARWMETGLAVGQSDEHAGEADKHAAAARAVSAASVPRFEPPPEPGDMAAKAGVGPNGSATLAAPSATVAAAGPGADGPGAGAPGAGGPGAGGPGAGAALTAQGVKVPPPVSNGQENRLPIFESVESDWFRRGRQVAERSAPVPDSGSAGWSSPADAGWQAAEVAQAPVSAGYTGAGLPKRVPKANLVPGAAGPSAAPPSSAPARSAAQARERLASFQQGIRKARAAPPEDESDTSGAADGVT